MNRMTEQMAVWSGDFGREYTDRNALVFEELEALYQKHYGVTRSELNETFLEGIDRSARILEVGSNIGNQLLFLRMMGFKDLHGIELQLYAIQQSKTRTAGIKIIQGSGLDIPFKDKTFDLVFTSGLLIHIAPRDIKKVMSEIYRCTKKYIWGLEYYSAKYVEINYREHNNLLWKADFSKLYRDTFTDLEMVREERLRYTYDSNVDSMFLLKKTKVR